MAGIEKNGDCSKYARTDSGLVSSFKICAMNKSESQSVCIEISKQGRNLSLH